MLMGKYRKTGSMHPLIPFIVSGKIRWKVFLSLDKPSPAVLLAKNFRKSDSRGWYRTSVARALRHLCDKGLVEKVPKMSGLKVKFVFYRRTNLGKKVADEMKESGYDKI